MFYREAGDFSTTYPQDSQTFPIRFDRYRYYVVLAVALLVMPFVMTDYLVNSIFLPFLIYAIAAIGLNILTGYCGQVSLGTGGFMAVGAYACYKLMTSFPDVNIMIHIVLAGGITAAVGAAFGLPSLRIKGCYLAVATLAAQFFLVWLFEKWPWLYNNNASGAIQVPNVDIFGVPVAGPLATSATQYYFVLGIVTVLTIVTINLTRGSLGRAWKSVRDMDIAAELIGINLLKAKLMAFAVSSYIVGVSGALFVFLWRGAAEPNLFDIELSFRVLFIAIIGGLGSILGNYLGAVLIVALPVILNTVPELVGLDIKSATVEHINVMIVGALIIFFLIVEPHGLARLWQLIREKLIIWPFPH